MTLADFFVAGKILRPHGLKGEVTIFLDADAPVNWEKLHGIYVEINGQFVPHRIERISIKGSQAFVKFKDVSNPDDAGFLQKRTLYLPKSERPKRTGLDFYDDEVAGFEVHEKTIGILGKVIRVERTGTNRQLIILHDDKERMIPVNGPFIKGINRTAKIIRVELPEGFLDI
ncbi:MAG: ribosome maturation factor RimM [Cyclobacteriaceae bacterium]|nr:ribosome maturation factor RimM [Cyclobacteriaceae bacterium]MCX7636326.1 ribosome maturation factor RimM [Cyclobacteriaceae bacterium]MDW8330318.1 ribosome maturation factor RimM [Cyclobacteriaceae bacterium]